MEPKRTMSNKESGEIRNILVALDASRHSMAALEAAVHLAHSLEANLEGLFVEDINWYRASQLSSTFEVGDLTGSVRSMGEKEMEQQVNALISRLRRAMVRMSEYNRVKNYRFRSERGDVDQRLLAAAEKADLITIGRSGQSFGQRSRLGHTARALIEKTSKPLLLLQKGHRLGNTLVLAFDPRSDDGDLIRFAQGLARKTESKLMIIALGRPDTDDQQIAQLVRRKLDQDDTAVSMRVLKAPDPFQLARMVNYDRGGLLIARRSQPLFAFKPLERIMADVSCPILLF